MKGKIISITVAVALLAALIYVSGPEEIAKALLRTDVLIASTASVFWITGLVVRTERWRFLMRKAGIVVPFRQAAKIYIASLFLSNVTPGKSGDPIRSVLLKKTCGDRVSSSLPSVIVERALDVASMILIGALGLAFVATTAVSSVIFWFVGAIVVYIVLFTAVVFTLSSEGRAKWMASKLSGIVSKLPKIKNYTGRMEGFLINMQKSLSYYGQKKVLLTAFLYSLIIWILEGAIVYIAFLSLSFQIPFWTVVTALSVTTLIAVLTFLPGGIGSSEIIIVAFFTSITALTMADITAVAILARVLSYWVYVVLGALFLATMKYK
jgi:hypothetical protein